MTLEIEFPYVESDIDMEHPKVCTGTAIYKIVYRVFTRSPTEPDAIGIWPCMAGSNIIIGMQS